jgi:hypothetical protein
MRLLLSPPPGHGRPTQSAVLGLRFILPITLLVLLLPNLAAAENPEVWTLQRIVVANGLNE